MDQCAIYCKNVDLQKQLEILTKIAKEKKLNIFRIYTDERSDNESLKHLIRDASKNYFKNVLILNFIILGETVTDMLNNIKNLEKHVEFITMYGVFNFYTPFSRNFCKTQISYEQAYHEMNNSIQI